MLMIYGGKIKEYKKISSGWTNLIEVLHHFFIGGRIYGY